MKKTISTIAIDVPLLMPEQLEKLDGWLRSVLWEGQLPVAGSDQSTPLEIHRLKARLRLSSGETKVVQGVREIFEIFDAPSSSSSEPAVQTGKIVLIGRQLQVRELEQSLHNSIQL